MFSIESVSNRKDEQAAARRAARNIRALLGNSMQRDFSEAEVMVTEIQCFDPECVPLETLIILMENEQKRSVYKILKPLRAVNEEDIMELVRANGLAVSPPMPPPTVTMVDMVPREHGAAIATTLPATQQKTNLGPSRRDVKLYAPFKPAQMANLDIEIRHNKGGVRQRGCPCCDPDSLENIVDKLLLQNTPP